MLRKKKSEKYTKFAYLKQKKKQQLKIVKLQTFRSIQSIWLQFEKWRENEKKTPNSQWIFAYNSKQM